jgi:acyl carrier protein
MDNDFEKTKQKVRRELADYLGVDMEDIEDDTVLTEELHMDPTVLTDFMEILAKAGFVIDGIELTEIETFSDLLEALTAHT